MTKCAQFLATLTHRRSLVALLFAFAGGLLLTLTWDLRPYPIPAHVDDYRYVLSAEHIKSFPESIVRQGEFRPWLGPYDTSTLFKRPGISIMLAGLATLYLPFIQTTLLIYLAGLAILANSLLRLKYSRVAVAALFLVCGLLPTLYDSNAVRVIREIATGGVELAIFGLCLRLYSIDAAKPSQLLRTPTFIALLAMLAFHWSLREEAILLLPSVLLLVNGALWLRATGGWRPRLAVAAVASALVFLPSQVAYHAFAALNQASYGLRIVNELSEGTFPRAVSVLKSVDESPCDHRLMTAEEVQKVKAVSASFGVVAPALETALARQPDMIYTDAFSVMRSAAIREMKIGSSPHLTQELFQRIADEVGVACRDGRLRCAERASGGIVPLLCASQWALVPENFAGYLFDKIGHVQHSGFSPWWSGLPGLDRLHPSLLANFEKITRQKMAGRHGDYVEFSQPGLLATLARQDFLRYSTASVYAAMMPWLLTLGAIVVLVRLRAWRDGSRSWWLILLVALAAHVVGRTLAFSYLSTVDGYLNTRYISVGYPIAAAFAVLAVAELRYLLIGKGATGSSTGPIMPDPAAVRWPRPLLILIAIIALAFIVAGKRSGSQPAAALEPALAPPSGVLAAAAGTELIVLEGKPIKLLTQRQGWMNAEAGWLRGDVAVFDGWAKDLANERPVESILVFADGRAVASTVPSVPMPALEERFASGAHAGFSMQLPRSMVAGTRVRVFALLSGDRAGELHYSPSFPYQR